MALRLGQTTKSMKGYTAKATKGDSSRLTAKNTKRDAFYVRHTVRRDEHAGTNITPHREDRMPAGPAV
jgi:hypothetical protein